MSEAVKQEKQAPHRWWNRLCRIGWILLRFFWGTVIAGLVVNTFVALSFLSRGPTPRHSTG